MDKVWFITMLKKERNLINQTKQFSFNHSPMRRGDKRSNYPMSHQNPTICEYRFMHQIRKILSNIGTSIASLEYACWAVVRMLYMFWGTEVHRASVQKTLRLKFPYRWYWHLTSGFWFVFFLQMYSLFKECCSIKPRIYLNSQICFQLYAW